MSTTTTTPMDIDNAVPSNSKGDSQLPWVEKYRPQRLEDLVAHEDIIGIITVSYTHLTLPTICSV